MDDLERLEALVANLLIMQKVMAANVEALQDILMAKGFITREDLEAINADIRDSLSDQELPEVG
jgi:hypothetical protein